MSLLVQRRGYDYNPSHWAAPRLLFAWRGGVTGSKYVQNAVRGRERFTATSAPVVSSRDGFGLSTPGDDNYWQSSALKNPSSYAGDLTLLWRGIILGDGGTGNYSVILGNAYGGGPVPPYQVFVIMRRHGAPNVLSIGSNDGATYTLADTDVGLSNYYGIPLTIAVSNVVNTTGLTCVIASPVRGFISQPSMNALTGTSATRATSSTDAIQFGPNHGAGRSANVLSTGGAIWNIAMNAQQLRDVALRSDAVFAAPSTIMSDALMYAGAAPPAGSYWGGYKTTHWPSTNAGLRVRS